MYELWTSFTSMAAVGWFWLPLGASLHLVALFLVCLDCLMYRRQAVSAILWIFIAWSFPVIGAVVYLVFGINRVDGKAWKKHRSDQEFLSLRRSREEDAMPLAYWRAVHEALARTPPDPFAQRLNKAMDAILPDYPLLAGNAITPLAGGDEAFPQMKDAMRRATHHIHLQTFMLGNDEVGREFLELLKEKALQGVTVRVLYDRFGSTRALLSGLICRFRGVPNLHLVGWTLANPLRRRFQINLRNHRKLLIVDGRVAFTGGINVVAEEATGRHGGPIRDYHFGVEGPIVQELQYSFLSDWYFMTDDNPDQLLCEEHFPHIPARGPAFIRVVNGGPTTQGEVLTDAFFTAITLASKELLAVTPYLVPTSDIVRALRSAALRGVQVRLVVPERNNHVYAGLASRGLYEDLLSAGVRIFERRPPFIHAKGLIVDNVFALVGTSNLDVRSLRLSYETNLAVYDGKFVDKLKRLIVEDISLSREVELAQWRKRPLRRKLLENVCGLLTPIL